MVIKVTQHGLGLCLSENLRLLALCHASVRSLVCKFAVVCVKFSKLLTLVMMGVGGAEPPYSAAPTTPSRRQAATALSSSFLRSLRCSMLR